MTATSINHVSVHAVDLERSIAFYEDIFGMQKIPTPNFAFPVQWLRLGTQQLHLFVRDSPAPQFHHIGLNVDDFELVHQRASELALHDTSAFFSKMYELPDGSVQMYLRDPAGNLVEVDWPDIDTLDPELAAGIVKLGDTVPQDSVAMRATLYLDRASVADR